MSSITNVTEATFKQEVLESTTPVLVDFWAPWCGPCRRVAPELDAVAVQLDGKAVIAKVNVDDESELAARYQIQSIPAMLIFKDGKVVDQLVGAYPRDTIASRLSAQI